MRFSLLAIAAALAPVTQAQQVSLHQSNPQIHALPPLREQASIVNRWVKKRRGVIPQILRAYGVEAWLVSSHKVCMSIPY